MELDKEKRIEKYTEVLGQIALSYATLYKLRESVGTITLDKFPPLLRDIGELIEGAKESEI